MNRIDRLTAILIQLQGKKIVRASEIADRFNISLRTVYRDVKALQEAGVPIGAEAGTGYYIVEGYHLPPVMFSKEEAAALLTGEKLMEQFSDHSNRKQFSLAMEKIRSVLRGTEKDYLESLDENIAVLRYRPMVTDAAEFPNRFLTDIQQALGMNQVISMEYFSFQEEVATRREVEPIGIFHSSANWHLIAFCRLRQGYRDFRVDRIRKLAVLPATYKKNKHLSLQDYLEQQRSSHSENTYLIKIAVDNDLMRYVREQKYYYGLMEEKVVGDKTELTFLQSSLNYFARWLIMFGSRVEVLQPEELKTAIGELVTELHGHYL
ncbi:Predicted DNA-binding transcriptional regulator YafY, contains an HTH and WYL domains [Chitinophaga ginsengisegetis]|uniref:Predicted DNA-binding transcriptional regulator YafY, contains an HTH and WYL domains n=1 Tax=Chitinophaga ginsengisegetis TaxID=393003 RepID=A0A1T5NQP0_9BACT|nr:YafY family protein [Chitinophaga ginsengisegetis]SKD02696.1 Predicted DNA-binding transcriptional regulator YafY, contains an HTH and WYL domains [Chitinophaga ginsengisegetis]